MMDRELLELAAKAAGINGWFIEDDEWLGTGIAFTDENDCNQCWNPLTDDGDALRLAVKLGLTLVIESDMVFCRNQKSDNAFREQGKDHYAATRRAIVRAAAEIGKRIK